LNKLHRKKAKILIELPTWLGDCVMSTPAIENIVNHYGNTEITVIGSKTSIEVFRNHPNVTTLIAKRSKFKSLFESPGVFDIYFSFRSSIRSKILKFNIKANKKFQFNHKKFQDRHQVEKYVDFVNKSLSIKSPAGQLIYYSDNYQIKKTKKLLGINPGATYGSAKRWYPEQFAKLAIYFSDRYDILIFGSKDELDFAKKIESYLIQNKITNYLNLAGKTSISRLTNYLSNIDIFVTGDSGPMHIAASFQIPTIAIFGPTNPEETSQWQNPNSAIVKKDLQCQPCMKRSCPLKHHNCMKLIDSQKVIKTVLEVQKKINSENVID
jgi:heptosyltransferase II